MAIVQRGQNFSELIAIMQRLLAPDGCPWDREQTLATLTPFLVKEAYGVPLELPALLRAQKLGEKAAEVGFDWPDVAGVRRKVDEELAEIDEAVAHGGQEEIEHEIGDLLLAVSRLAAKLGVAPEDALRS